MRRFVVSLIVLLVGLGVGVADAGNTSRRTGKQAIQDDSVYRQQTPEGVEIPKPYGGTRRNIPVGPNFIQRARPTPEPPEEEEPEEEEPEEQGEPDEPEETEAPPGDTKFGCVKEPYDVRADVPNADRKLRYTLGFERGFAGCLEKQVTIENIALAAFAAKFKEVAAVLTVLAAPSVIDGVLHPPGTSANPNPYLRGKDEGERLCEWALKVSPALVARCRPGKGGAAPGKGGAAAKTCTAAAVVDAYGNAAADAAANGTKRFDCFACTMAWLKGETYTPPANGGTPVTFDSVVAIFESQFGTNVPKGPALPCWRQTAQSKGIPGSMSEIGIVKEMEAAGDGAKAVIFIRDPATEIGHVVGVRTIGDPPNAVLEFWDPQQGRNARSLLTPDSWIALYRIE